MWRNVGTAWSSFQECHFRGRGLAPRAPTTDGFRRFEFSTFAPTSRRQRVSIQTKAQVASSARSARVARFFSPAPRRLDRLRPFARSGEKKFLPTSVCETFPRTFAHPRDATHQPCMRLRDLANSIEIMNMERVTFRPIGGSREGIRVCAPYICLARDSTLRA